MKNVFSKIYVENLHGNINTPQQGNKLNATFSKINLQTYLNGVKPTFSNNLVQRIKSSHLQVIFSKGAFDKFLFLRNLAVDLASPAQIEVKEWVGNDGQSILSAIRKMQKNSVLLIDNVHPKDVNYDLEKLNELAQNNGHYLILSTTFDENSWHLNSGTVKQLFWYEISNPVYHTSDLERLLRNVLAKKQALIKRLDRTARKYFFEPAERHWLVSNLKAPHTIYFFMQLLKSNKNKLTEQVIQDTVKMAVSNQDAFYTKTYKKLDRREKLIVMGLSVFNNVYEDQFFAGMSNLVDNSWGQKDPDLHGLDYSDLRQNVSSFFRFSDASSGNRLLIPQPQNLRHLIIKEIWPSYRRQFVRILPVLSTLAINSVTNQADNWELFGTKEKRRRLRDTISHTISDIGLKSVETIEGTLVELASHYEMGVQVVAAKAMARWRGFNKDRLLMDVLERWQKDTKFVSIVNRFLKTLDLNEDSDKDPINYLRATIVLTLGYAAGYDKPDQLDDKLVKVLNEFLNDETPQVQNRMEWILPEIVRHHPIKLQNNRFLAKCLENTNLIFPVAIGLARGYADYPEKIVRLLSTWLKHLYKHYSSTRPNGTTKTWASDAFGKFVALFTAKKIRFSLKNHAKVNELSLEDKRTAVILFFCQQLIITNGITASLGKGTAISVLAKFRDLNVHIALKSIIFDILVDMISLKHRNIADILIATLQGNEHEMLVEALGQRYIRERKKQKGNKETVRINNQKFPIWVDHARPLTELEESVADWLTNGQAKYREIAFRARLHFAELLDTKEELAIKKIKEQREALARLPDEIVHKIPFSQKWDEFKAMLIFWVKQQFASLGASSSNRKTLAAIQPVLKSSLLDEQHMATVILKLEKEGPEGKKLAKALSTMTGISLPKA